MGVMRQIAAAALTLIGAAAALAGIGVIYWPAALIIGGVAVCYVGLFRLDVR